jgi:hypothetical protein
MNRFEDLYDFPMSWSCWRGICQSNGHPVPPPDRPELPSHEEDRQQFIKWQDEQYRLFYSEGRISSFKESKSPRPMYKQQHMSKIDQLTDIYSLRK